MRPRESRESRERTFESSKSPRAFTITCYEKSLHSSSHRILLSDCVQQVIDADSWCFGRIVFEAS